MGAVVAERARGSSSSSYETTAFVPGLAVDVDVLAASPTYQPGLASRRPAMIGEAARSADSSALGVSVV